mmetsp:Transcript_22475/g.62066  ORF Transcript_22475/g.62066 Transcript_22475/m.62066 type:complete len:93 (-) Transcript_22475:878-1156(-)
MRNEHCYRPISEVISMQAAEKEKTEISFFKVVITIHTETRIHTLLCPEKPVICPVAGSSWFHMCPSTRQQRVHGTARVVARHATTPSSPPQQ